MICPEVTRRRRALPRSAAVAIGINLMQQSCPSCCGRSRTPQPRPAWISCRGRGELCPGQLFRANRRWQAQLNGINFCPPIKPQTISIL